MPTAIIGQTYTFSVLFVDNTNTPIAVLTPTAKVFRFNSAGAEVIVASGAMTAVVGDFGRYSFTFTVPTSLTAGTTLFAVLSGIDPGTLALMMAEDSTDLLNNPQVYGGLIARFIR